MSGRKEMYVYSNVTISCFQIFAFWTLLRWSYHSNSQKITLCVTVHKCKYIIEGCHHHHHHHYYQHMSYFCAERIIHIFNITHPAH
jgi:hypothetical protein